MKIKVTRTYKADTYTIGKMYIDGLYFCDTLEDKVRDLTKEAKVMHETAIPYGTYKARLSMSNRFKRILPEILNVPHFTGIRAHAGNFATDSSGCILVGENKAKGMVSNSKHYETSLVQLMEAAEKRGESITIEIV